MADRSIGTSDTSKGTTRSERAVIFVLLTSFIHTLGLGIVVPVLPGLIIELSDRSVEEAARIGGWLLLVYAVMQFFFGPILGMLSDRYGRRPVLLLSLAVFAIDYALTAFAPNLLWLFAGRAIAGMAGATQATILAFVADISPPQRRAQRFGLVGLMFGLAFIIGPAVGGLLGVYGARLPFLVAGGIALLNLIYGLLVLPESLPADHRRTLSLDRANPLAALRRVTRFDPAARHVLLALGIWWLALQAIQSTWPYYVEHRYGWNTFNVGLSLAAIGLGSALVQGLLTGRMIARLGESGTARFGLACGVFCFVALSAASFPAILMVGIGLSALSSVVFPALNGLLSRGGDPSGQGELQGLVAAVQNLTTIVGPPIMTQIFAAFSEDGAPVSLPGAQFMLSAVLAAASLAIVARLIVPPRLSAAGEKSLIPLPRPRHGAAIGLDTEPEDEGAER